MVLRFLLQAPKWVEIENLKAYLFKKKIMHLIKLLSFIEKLHFKNSRLFFSVLNHKLLAIRYYISNFLVSLRVPSMMFDLL